jgi:hypothetical protein
MTIDLLMTADAADTANGKIYALGAGWNQHKSPLFPAPIRLAIALTIALEKNELAAVHRLSIDILDHEHQPVVPTIEAEVQAQSLFITTRKAILPFAVNLAFPLPRPGQYTIEARCEGAIRTTDFESFLVHG